MVRVHLCTRSPVSLRIPNPSSSQSTQIPSVTVTVCLFYLQSATFARYLIVAYSSQEGFTIYQDFEKCLRKALEKSPDKTAAHALRRARRAVKLNWMTSCMPEPKLDQQIDRMMLSKDDDLIQTSPLTTLASQLDRASLLTVYVKQLDERTNGQFCKVVEGLEAEVLELAIKLKSSASLHPSEILNANDGESTLLKLEGLYQLFLGGIEQIRRRAKLFKPSRDDDSVISPLIDIINREFLRFIAMFDGKSWESWSHERDVKFFLRTIAPNPNPPQRDKAIPSIPVDDAALATIDSGVSLLQLEIESSSPTENRKKILENLQETSKGVSSLRNQTQDFIELLSVITSLVHVILQDARAIQTKAMDIFSGFKKYSDAVIIAVPFLEFLPNDQHYIVHLTKANHYLAARKLKTGLKFAHFVAAFECLLAPDCETMHAF